MLDVRVHCIISLGPYFQSLFKNIVYTHYYKGWGNINGGNMGYLYEKRRVICAHMFIFSTLHILGDFSTPLLLECKYCSVCVCVCYHLSIWLIKTLYTYPLPSLYKGNVIINIITLCSHFCINCNTFIILY